MAQTIHIPISATEVGDPAVTHQAPYDHAVPETQSPTDRFVAELRRMTPQERINTSRYTMNRWERSVYAARYPDEAPTVNGELEWIAVDLE
jgi:hypothetical protein